MSHPEVRVEFPRDACAVVRLDRPAAKNALTAAMRRELVRLFADELPARARVVVLTGAGGAFCAGLDLQELGAAADPRPLIVAEELDVARAMRAFDGPIIGAVDGAAVTGGFELALACDLLLASEAARFADTHARIGVLPAWGLSQELSRRIGPARAKQMSFTGNFIDAQRALAWGLVNEVVPRDALMPAALGLADDMLSTEPQALRAYKRLIDDGARLAHGDALALEQARAAAWAETLTASALAQRRAGVIARGQDQQSTLGRSS
ncbi:enoyl-CoA hydratase [Ramlibacter sp.]|uniref:enoyl-CoA hydratase n=1 Tax=Ramlibacter sp. TaxID=1917967 RepID=UPI003D0FC806